MQVDILPHLKQCVLYQPAIKSRKYETSMTCENLHYKPLYYHIWSPLPSLPTLTSELRVFSCTRHPGPQHPKFPSAYKVLLPRHQMLPAEPYAFTKTELRGRASKSSRNLQAKLSAFQSVHIIYLVHILLLHLLHFTKIIYLWVFFFSTSLYKLFKDKSQVLFIFSSIAPGRVVGVH